MKIIALGEFLQHKNFYVKEAEAGKLFVYPTDTIYGIGAIYNKENVEKIFAIKKRDTQKLFSIIAPSFERIGKNYESPLSNDELKIYMEKYHGITYIFRHDQPGVRIIKHPFQGFVEQLGKPFITTSCNISGEPVIIDIKDLPEEITSQVDYIIDGGIGGGRPSVLIDFVADKIIER